MLQNLITQQHYFVLKLFSALGCGLIAGVFFAFSSFVMSALARLQPAQGIYPLISRQFTNLNCCIVASINLNKTYFTKLYSYSK